MCRSSASSEPKLAAEDFSGSKAGNKIAPEDFLPSRFLSGFQRWVLDFQRSKNHLFEDFFDQPEGLQVNLTRVHCSESHEWGFLFLKTVSSSLRKSAEVDRLRSEKQNSKNRLRKSIGCDLFLDPAGVPKKL